MIFDTSMDAYAQCDQTHLFDTLLDAQSALIFVTDGASLFTCNRRFLDFFGFETIASFKSAHACVGDFFEPCPGFLSATVDGVPWAEYVLNHRNEPQRVKIVRGDAVYIFELELHPSSLKGLLFGYMNDVSALHLLKERYEFALKGANEGLWDWDLRTDTIYFSPRWKEMLGYGDDELPCALESWSTLVHPDDLQGALDAITHAHSAPNRNYDIEYRMRHKNGAWIWILDKGFTLFDLEGTAVRMIGTHADITRIKASEARNALHARRAEVMLALPDLSESLSKPDFMQRMLEMAEELTQSPISFIHFVNDDEQSIELITWSRRTLDEYCHVVHDRHYPVTQAGIWADALRERRAIVINDYPKHPHKRGLPEGHAPLERFISLPVIEDNKVVMLCGIGNKDEAYNQTDVETLQLLANETWRLVQRQRNRIKLQQTQEMLLAQSRYAAMGEMIGMIAHQWRQPIAVIAMGVNNIIADIELELFNPLQARQALEELLDQTRKLSMIIDDFRTFFASSSHDQQTTLRAPIEEALEISNTTTSPFRPFMRMRAR
ncbi:MAG: GAF domain-containing protein [Campylobacterales bacterium]|nr:GAF domain-containing protein [Campylobacterales bacterium]